MTYSRILYAVGLVLILILEWQVNTWPTLLILCLYIFLPIASILLSLFTRNRVTLKLQIPSGLEQGQTGDIILEAENLSRFAIPRVVARVSISNYLTGTTVEHRSEFPAAGRSVNRKTIHMVDAEIGRVDVVVTDLYITDALLLARFHVQANQHGSFLVEPPDIPVSILMGEATELEGSSQKYSDTESGHDVSETFDHRTYEPGDSIRSIHWKLSSKYDDLIVREYGKPVEYSVVLLAELAESSSAALESCVGYTVGISRCLLENGLLHTIAWYDAGADEYCSFNITNFETMESAILRMIVSCPHPGISESLARFLDDLEPSGQKKTLFYFTTNFDNGAMLQAACQCTARAAIIGTRGRDTADDALSVDTLPEDCRLVSALRLDMKGDI